MAPLHHLSECPLEIELSYSSLLMNAEGKDHLDRYVNHLLLKRFNFITSN